MVDRVLRIGMAAALLVGCGGGRITGGGDGGTTGDAAGHRDGGHFDGGPGADASDVDASPEPPTVTATFTEIAGDVVNPERGFYSYVDLLGEDDLSWVRARGDSLAFSYIRLDDYRDRALDDALLGALADGFDVARAAHLKLVLRFAYNDGPYPDSEPDAPLAQVLEHIGQLGPILSADQDVLAVLQAGFIGAWGEWHTSTNGLTTPENKQAILDALLAALPEDRMIQLRYPPDLMSRYPTPLDADTGFTGTAQARIGHHNDCFLASASDMGTYGTADATMAEEQAYLAATSRFVPLGGETCAVYSPRSDCASALSEMEMLGFSFLNQDYHPDVIAAWQDQGCEAEIRRRLGYRLVLERVTCSERVRPGGILGLTVDLDNVGFAALYNRRPLLVVVSGQDARYQVELAEVDPRRFAAGETSSFTVRLRLPAAIAPGSYQVALWLPDPAPALRDVADYAIRLANDGVWAGDGRNVVVADLPIDADAPGDYDPDASELSVLP